MKFIFPENSEADLKWIGVRNAISRGDEPLLKNFCISAHKMARKGPIIVNSLILRPRILTFKNENYSRRRVDVLSYGISGVTHPKYDENYWYMAEGDHSYITEGKRPDCVYYLSLLNSMTMKFALVKHVCGIDVKLDDANVTAN